jgi:hypothetical protein
MAYLLATLSVTPFFMGTESKTIVHKTWAESHILWLVLAADSGDGKSSIQRYISEQVGAVVKAEDYMIDMFTMEGLIRQLDKVGDGTVFV